MSKNKKQKFKKKTILSCLKGKTVLEAMLNFEGLVQQGFGDCKIEFEPGLTSSGPAYYRLYNGKIKCNILVPVDEE